MVKNEGPKALYLGLTPALTRSVLYGGLRLGLYEPSKCACNKAFGSTNILVKIVSGAFAGGFATALTNPVEVIKVRLQMNTNQKQVGPIAEMRKIVSEEGIRALWKGVGPAVARASALTASQLATYDETKQVMLTEGPIALYKGGFAIFARLGPQTMITFILCEKMRQIAGLNAI